jgi:hypothetical protein
MVVAIAASPIRDSPVRYAVALDGLTHCQVDSLSREAEPPSLPLVVPLACHIRGSNHGTKWTTTVTRISR